MEEFVIVKRAVKGRIRMELRIREVDKGGAARVTNTHKAGPNFRQDSTRDSCAKRSRPRVGFVFHCPLISGHRVDKINIPSQAKEEFVILKHSVKGRIRMELRIREVDKGGVARVTNTREAGPNLR
jgi:hypothetical protein